MSETLSAEVEQLRPCPFCGGHAELIGERDCWTVQCATDEECRGSSDITNGSNGYTRASFAVAAWNRRAYQLDRPATGGADTEVLEEWSKARVHYVEPASRPTLDAESAALSRFVDHVAASRPGEDAALLANMERRKDAAYEERNRVVAALARCFPSGVGRTAIEGWSDDWHGCVYIDLPTGQVSWHFHDSHAHLFAGFPPYTGQWDGHTTEEKYERVAALRSRPTLSPADRSEARKLRDKLNDGRTVTNAELVAFLSRLTGKK